jgi:transcriptional accessory protein Tex/SPT6
MKKILLLTVLLPLLISCFPYIYYTQEEVIINGIDIDQTLKIAVNELKEGGFDSILTIWAIRDQVMTPEQAKKINDIYLEYKDKIEYENDTTKEFGTWHFAWAISNIYRNGDENIKNEIMTAYNDAKKIPETLKRFKKIADEHINGEKIYMGDVHGLGRSYAKTHIIAPGNNEYVQTYEDYLKYKETKKNI